MQKQPHVCAGTSAKEAFFNNANWSGRHGARRSLVLVASAAALTVAQSLLPSPSAQAATIYWDAAPGGAPWTTTTNWNTSGTADTPDPAAAPGTNDIAEFNRVTATQPTFSTASAITVGAIWLTGSVGSTTILNTNATPTFNFAGGQTVNSTANVGIWIDDNLNKSLQVGLTGTTAWNGVIQNSQTWFVGTGDVLTLNGGTFAGSINLNGKTLTIDGAGTTNLGRINAAAAQTSGTIIKKGSGSTVNTGGFAGTIGQVQLNGGRFELSINWSTARLTSAAGFDFTGNSTLALGNTGAVTDLSSKIKIEDGVTATLDAGTGNTVDPYATTFQVGALGTGGFIKTGSSALTLSAVNTYKGGTTISVGTLRAANSSAFGSGNVDVKGTVAVGADTTHVGTLNINNTSQASTWETGGSYAWKTISATDSPGTNNDVINMTSLNVTATHGSPFTIVLSDLSAAGGTAGSAPAVLAPGDSWTLATTTSTAQMGGVNVTSGAPLTSGLSTDVFSLDTSNFKNSGGTQIASGAFTLDFVTIGGGGDNLVLTYTGAPEPGSALLLLSGVLPMLRTRRRRRAVVACAGGQC